MSNYILVINPGSTSTKIGVFENDTLLFDKTLRHPAEEIAKFATIPDQKSWRKELVEQALTENSFNMKKLTAICARGGLVKPIRGGTYATSDALLADCVAGVQGQHACNLGGLIAREIGDELGIPSFIADPPVVDEMQAIARYSGHPLIQRVSKFHALNQKAVAKRYAKEVGKKYEELNLIVCHMGGGVSVGAHVKGSVVDTENALDGEGPFSPERSGSLPTDAVMRLCFSGDYTEAELRSRYEIMLENYCKTVCIEAQTMSDMARKQILPAVAHYAADVARDAAGKQALDPDIRCGYEAKLVKKLTAVAESIDTRVDVLDGAIARFKTLSDVTEGANFIRDEMLSRMTELRVAADEAETLTAESAWPFPTYGDLLFSVK